MDSKMATKPDAKEWNVKEQIVEDRVSGLTLQFETVPESSAPFRLRIFGSIPFGNRELLFGETGEAAGSGTYVAGCRPSWLKSVD